MLDGGMAGSRVTSGVALASMLLIWVVIWYLVSRLASTVRARDRALFVANARLQASIEERSKHMLQTTHQLKAPFAAIHAQVQLLLEGYCGVLPAAAMGVVEKISRRCRVLSRQVQEMLQLANLRSHGQTAPPARELALDHLVADVIHRVEPAAQQRGIGFDRQLEPVRLQGIEDHLTMLVDNLVVNAVTYSHDRGVVAVACRRESPGGRCWSCRTGALAFRRRSCRTSSTTTIGRKKRSSTTAVRRGWVWPSCVRSPVRITSGLKWRVRPVGGHVSRLRFPTRRRSLRSARPATLINCLLNYHVLSSDCG
ncbi:MAG: hypothetical protein M5U12_04060 [Verrucomicrobia bacterium]|nr:hypothetical protein [Verrucomicrobiota bacterium]